MSFSQREYKDYEIWLLRAQLNRCIRAFFDNDNFIEVETPILSPKLIPEPTINIFETRQKYQDGGYRSLYITPSPEIWMKRIVASGLPRVFQFAHSFRNIEEQGPFHSHEFTMLEWYATDDSYIEALSRIERLLSVLQIELGSSALSCTRPPVKKIYMTELWETTLGLDPANATKKELRATAEKFHIEVGIDDSWEQLFNRIFLSSIEPLIDSDCPVVVFDYPQKLTTLAATTEDGAHAQRWELYLAGVEVANCYQEETDFKILSKILSTEASRQKNSEIVPDPDLDLAQNFSSVQACSGVAIGLDRLYAAILGLPAISLLNPFTRLF